MYVCFDADVVLFPHTHIMVLSNCVLLKMPSGDWRGRRQHLFISPEVCTVEYGWGRLIPVPLVTDEDARLCSV